MPSIINSTTSSGLVTSADNSGSLQLATNNGTTAVTIDTSQNVGIGTTTPSAPLQVNGTATAVRATSGQVWLSRSSNTTQYQGVCLRGGPATDGFVGRAPNSDNIIFGFDAGSSLTTQMSLNNNGDLQFNSGYGSVATAFGVRAWVTFNGSGSVAIQGSGGVSSVVDNGSGNYTVNFSTTMPDTVWSGQVTCGGPNGSGSSFTYTGTVYNRATTNCGINTWASNGGVALQDPEQVNFLMVR